MQPSPCAAGRIPLFAAFFAVAVSLAPWALLQLGMWAACACCCLGVGPRRSAALATVCTWGCLLLWPTAMLLWRTATGAVCVGETEGACGARSRSMMFHPVIQSCGRTILATACAAAASTPFMPHMLACTHIQPAALVPAPVSRPVPLSFPLCLIAQHCGRGACGVRVCVCECNQSPACLQVARRWRTGWCVPYF